MAENQLAPEAPVVDPAVATAAEPPPAPASEPAAEPAVEPEPAPEPEHGNKGQTPWFMRRIHEETNKGREERRLRVEAEERARNAEEMLARLQKPEQPAPERIPSPAAPPKDFETAVRTEAQRLRLYDDTVAVKNAGLSAFKDFNESLGILNAVGATSDDFVLDVLAVDKANAHVIYDKLAKDPEKAASLAGMDSRHRIAELTRMIPMAEPAKTETPTTPAPRAAISRAPAPKPVMEPSAPAAEPDWNDSDPSLDAKFSRAWEDKFRKRASA